MYKHYRPAKFNQLPVIVKNLLIINGLLFLAMLFFRNYFQRDILSEKLAMTFILGDQFKFYQPITHMFMHADFGHIFFNMFALWFFGYRLENLWGAKRFLIFYLVCGLGAASIETGWNAIQISKEVKPVKEFLAKPEIGGFDYLVHTYTFRVESDANQAWVTSSIDEIRGLAGVGKTTEAVQSATVFCESYLNDYYNMHSMVGASGAVFGILMAFGYLFANTELQFWGLPFNIKAKWFVIFYGASELLYAIKNNPNDNVAHFAHLGGMLFGFILLKIYNRNRKQFY